MGNENKSEQTFKDFYFLIFGMFEMQCGGMTQRLQGFGSIRRRTFKMVACHNRGDYRTGSLKHKITHCEPSRSRSITLQGSFDMSVSSNLGIWM